MLKVGDVDVLTLGCEVVTTSTFSSSCAFNLHCYVKVMALLAIDDTKRNKMIELGTYTSATLHSTELQVQVNGCSN